MHTFSYSKSMFLFLAALIFSNPTLARHHNNDSDSLSGSWSHNGRQTSINKNYLGQYIFCNENRDCATGFLAHGRIIEVPNWSVTGRFEEQFNSITWSNGTRWFRYNPYHSSYNSSYNTSYNSSYREARVQGEIQGRWYHNGRPTYIEMDRNGRRFLLTNEISQTNTGYRQGNQLILPELNITGHLSYDGRRISWSNNTTWVR